MLKSYAQHQAERIAGLTLEAQSLVSRAKEEKSGEKYNGVIGSVYYLNQYTFPDGRVYKEKVQSECGKVDSKVIFVALRDEKGAWVPESLWTQEELRLTVILWTYLASLVFG